MTIATALDHLTDVLAGEDVAAEQTIEQSVNKIANMIESGEITIGGGGGGGYDCIVKLNNHELAYVTSGEIVKGTYADMKAKALSEEPLNILVYGYGEAWTNHYNTTFGVQCFTYTEYVEEGEEPIFIVMVNGTKSNLSFDIKSDNTIIIED